MRTCSRSKVRVTGIVATDRRSSAGHRRTHRPTRRRSRGICCSKNPESLRAATRRESPSRGLAHGISFVALNHRHAALRRRDGPASCDEGELTPGRDRLQDLSDGKKISRARSRVRCLVSGVFVFLFCLCIQELRKQDNTQTKTQTQNFALFAPK